MKKFLVYSVLGILAFVGFEIFYEPPVEWKKLSSAQWRQRLSAEQFEVLREGTTEDAYSGKLLKEDRSGQYLCAGCSAPLFSSSAKFDSGTGWPSFDEPLRSKTVTHHRHNTLLAVAVEVKCARCEGHLGHVFPDGPTSTGARYCINSVALEFETQEH